MHRIMRSSTASLTAFLLVLTVTADGCKSNKSASDNPHAAAVATQSVPAAQNQAVAPQMSLDDLVVPIALYPDQLLGQLLLAARAESPLSAKSTGGTESCRCRESFRRRSIRWWQQRRSRQGSE